MRGITGGDGARAGFSRADAGDHAAFRSTRLRSISV
jgi:hypothetical protein